MSISMFRKALVSLVLISLAASAACVGHNSSARVPSLAELQAARTQVRIEDNDYVLEGYLWRDFMPSAPPDGRPLQVVIMLVDTDGRQIPEDLKMMRLWVIHDEEVWETRFSDESRPDAGRGRLEKIARDGPKWKPGSVVDVVVMLGTKKSEQYLLSARELTIEQTN
ncbi:MAG: hypothetical protein OEU36_06015 [Gammaproteobacteria bacterium]|nr:hypothetical protein [Gammaproteobacteria bacterium]